MAMGIWSWLNGRGSGVFLHISSLPGGHGIGCFGKSANDFVKFLTTSGMKYWQVCPLNPTSYGDSPYQSPSAFAGNPYFIDLRDLIGEGLLVDSDLHGLEPMPESFVNFGDLYKNFWPVLKTAFGNFLHLKKDAKKFDDFCQRSAWWLDNYATFMAIKDQFGGRQWIEWPKEFSNHQVAMGKAGSDEKLSRRVNFYKFAQWIFDRQWNKLKNFANGSGIEIIGDIPIFVGFDSADVWANRQIFKLQKDGSPKFVAGVPPDAFSKTGQLWGNPVYDWDILAADNFSWWTNRIKRCAELYDVVRLDHFRGFCDYWEIPAPATTGMGGKWEKSVGIKFFKHVKKIFPHIKFIAEDLGCLNDDVIQLLCDTGLPGMNVLHFAFDWNNKNKYLPHGHEKNSVLYLGTHDNDTTAGWFRSLPEDIKHQVRCYLRTSCDDVTWDFIKKAYESPSNLLILSMQDILNLGSEARFNTPNTPCGNWQWRMTREQFDGLCESQTPQYLCHLRDTYGR
ncbi:MAG: 4-alpha-glucanotransferase [Puniceicoccales bacterium]|jgi:4-alpha-glucanotransferase|nr:4-alpha-glucanotransferase [Puniceicoccales bacterium]